LKTSPLSVLRSLRQLVVSRHEFLVFALLISLGVVLALTTETFLTLNNLSNISRALSWIAIAALGESLVLIIGGIDLSVGAVMALAGLTCASSLRAGLPITVSIFFGLLTGGLLGWINGLLVGHLDLPPLMVTLSTMSLARGAVFGLTGGWPVRDLPLGFRALGQWDLHLGFFSLPIPLTFVLGLGLLTTLFLQKTVLGRYIYALANSERALSVSGVEVKFVKVFVYTLAGLLTAVAGMLMTARLGVAAPTAASDYELQIIAAAVIGGASLFGGEGSVLGVLLGATVMQVLQNGLVLLGFPAYWQTAATGLLILFFILLDYWRRRTKV
jgi:ribose transport system permease protein